MKRPIALVITLALALAVAAPALAEEAVTKTFAVPVDRVWATTLAVLKTLGWDIDKEERTLGWIITDSRRVEGDDFGVYAKGTRHRLTLHVKPAGDGKTTVSVERALFKRERILWMDNDEPLMTKDRTVERSILGAIEKSL